MRYGQGHDGERGGLASGGNGHARRHSGYGGLIGRKSDLEATGGSSFGESYGPDGLRAPGNRVGRYPDAGDLLAERKNGQTEAEGDGKGKLI